MKNDKIKLLMALFLAGISLAGLQAQQAAPAAGNDATGGGGAASYSIGQPVYTGITSPNGSVNQGVQQSYCDDNNPCTTDDFDLIVGCVFTPLNCNDNNTCTTDACDIGTCTHTPIPNCTPAPIPTLSEWGLILFMLLLLGYGTAAIMRYQPEFAASASVSYLQLPYSSGSLPFNKELYWKVMTALMPSAVVGFVLVHYFIGTNGALDFAGTMVSSLMVGYIVHLIIGAKK